MPNNDDVQLLPFVALEKLPKQLHIIRDRFMLIQNINLTKIVNQAQMIGIGFITVKTKYDKLNQSYTEVSSSEQKLSLMLQHLASTIETGLQFLPHDQVCLKRKKRSIIDEEVVNTHPLFPSVGKLFGWVTGSLSVDAGKYINQNYNNIRRLTLASKHFAAMFNTSLKIEEKHAKQILQVKEQVEKI